MSGVWGVCVRCRDYTADTQTEETATCTQTTSQTQTPTTDSARKAGRSSGSIDPSPARISLCIQNTLATYERGSPPAEDIAQEVPHARQRQRSH